MEFDCKTELPGGGGECETQDECYANYEKGVEEVLTAKNVEIVPEEEEGSAATTIVFIVVVIVLIGICAIAFCIYK